MRDGKLLHLDERKIYEEARNAAEDLRGRPARGSQGPEMAIPRVLTTRNSRKAIVPDLSSYGLGHLSRGRSPSQVIRPHRALREHVDDRLLISSETFVCPKYSNIILRP